MHIPGPGQNGTQASRSRSSPKGSFLLDLVNEGVNRRQIVVENALVPVLPDHPWHEERDGGQTFAKGLGGVLPCLLPPILQRGFIRWRAGGQS